MTEDRAHNIWGIALGTPRRLVRIDGSSRFGKIIPAPQVPAAAIARRRSREWHLAGPGQWRSGAIPARPAGDLSFPQDRSKASAARQARDDARRRGTGSRMRPRWAHRMAQRHACRTLTIQNGLPCSGVHALVFDAQGALWLYTQCGLVNDRGADLRKWWERGDARSSRSSVFDALDGVRSGAGRRSNRRASRAPDGRLWFANETVVQMIDPARQAANAIPPPVHIEQVVADRKSYPRLGLVRLPPLTSDLEIDYVGLSFVAPQKVRFRYRLEGRDRRLAGTGHAASGVLQRSPPGDVSLPCHRLQQRRPLERTRRRARHRHRSGLVSDERVSGAVRHRRRLVRRGRSISCACVRWRARSTPASTSGWRNALAWRAIFTTRCCRPCRAARWSSTTR